MSAEATATTIAATLENTSLKAPSNGSKPDSADEGADAPDQNQDEAATPTKEGRRLHLRNIAYATDEGELKAFFNDFEVYVSGFPFISLPTSISNPSSPHRVALPSRSRRTPVPTVRLVMPLLMLSLPIWLPRPSPISMERN